jgi:hypothetical protein
MHMQQRCFDCKSFPVRAFRLLKNTTNFGIRVKPQRPSSYIRHRRYTYSAKPGPGAVWIAIAERTIFGTEQEYVIKASMETIGRYFNDRLGAIFPGVAKKPGVLRNSTNNPLYLLCFAVGNERGAPIALKIAEHLLKGLR